MDKSPESKSVGNGSDVLVIIGLCSMNREKGHGPRKHLLLCSNSFLGILREGRKQAYGKMVLFCIDLRHSKDVVGMLVVKCSLDALSESTPTLAPSLLC